MSAPAATATAGTSRPARAWWRRFEEPGAALTAFAAAAVVVLVFRRLLLGEVLFRRDVHLMWYAQVEAFVRAIAAGEWPLWNPDIGLGQPLWADANVQVLYPPTWLNLAVRPWTAYTAYVFAHLVLAALGARTLGRALGLSPAAAAAAALLWLASGPLLSLGEVWNQLAGAAWMPWALAAAIAALRTGRVAPSLAWGAATAAQVLGGAPEAALLTSAGALAYAAVVRPWSRRESVARAEGGGGRSALLAAATAGAIAACLSAGQWLPSLAAAAESARATLSPESRAYWSVHPLGLVQLLLPLAADALPLAPGAALVLFGGRDPLLPSLYLGLASVPLAAAAAAGHRLRAAAWLLAGMVTCIALALGPHLPLHGVLTALVPPLQALRYPVKAMPAAALCWALLCGIGFEAWRPTEALPRRRWTRFVLATAALLAAAGVAAALLVAGWPEAVASRLLAPGDALPVAQRLAPAREGLALAAACSLAAVGLAWARRRAEAPRGLAAAATVLAVADLVLAHASLAPTAPRALFTFRPPVIDAARPAADGRVYSYDYFVPGRSLALLGRPEPFAITRAPVAWSVAAATALSMRMSLFPPSGAPWGIAGSFDHDTPGIAPRRSALLVETLLQVEGTPAHARLLAAAGVQRVVALHTRGLESLPLVAEVDALLPEPVRVRSVEGALPRAYAVGRAIVARGDADALRVLLDPAFDPTAAVVLAEAPEAPTDGPAPRATVRVDHIGADRVRLDADLDAPGYVVLADAWAPGWTARVGGRDAPVLRANVGLRAVPVPAGRHTVELRYRAPGLAAGLALSGAALVVGAAAALRSKRGRPGAAAIP